MENIYDKYGEMFWIYANIEAIRQSGETNMFDWNAVRYLYMKHFPMAPDCPTAPLTELLFNGLPEDLQDSDAFNSSVKQGLLCIQNGIPDIFSAIDNECPDESLYELVEEFDLRPSQVKTIKRLIENQEVYYG